MNALVLAVFAQFTDALEGHCDCMYLDVKGLVTTGRGNLIDPIIHAQALPWTLDGAPATALQIASEWWMVKHHQELAHASYPDRRAITSLRLSNTAIDALTNARLEENDRILASRFDTWAEMPPDAILAVHSLAWACGPMFAFPKLEAALRAGDYYRPISEDDPTPIAGCAAAEVIMGGVSTNPGLAPRNHLNQRLLTLAQRGEPVLHYPEGAPDPI